MLDMDGSNLQCDPVIEDEDLGWDTQFSDSFSYSQYINRPLFVEFHISRTDYSLGSLPGPNKPLEAMSTSPTSNNTTFFDDWSGQDLKSTSNVTITPTTYPWSIATLPFANSEAVDVSPTHDVSPQACQPPTSISPPNLYPKRPCSSNVEIEAPMLKQPVTRKRGRPRLNRTVIVSSEDSGKSAVKSHKTRIPHTEVERKYRRGLNAEIDRLRCVVPTLPQIHDGTAIGQARLSKGMVLSAAIDYIIRTEFERDAALEELDMLGSGNLIA